MAIPDPFWRELNYFTVDEFTCRCGCGQNEMKQSFMLTLDELREFCGFSLSVSSGYRCPEHNDNESSTGKTGPHTTGCAADFKIYGHHAMELVLQCHRVGITGVGISQASSTPHNKRFVHLDSLPETPECPRPWLWSY